VADVDRRPVPSSRLYSCIVPSRHHTATRGRSGTAADSRRRTDRSHRLHSTHTQQSVVLLSLNSTGQTPQLTPTSSPTSARVFSQFSSPTCPRTFVRRALFLARMSVGDARVYTCTCTTHDKLSCTRLQTYTIVASLKSVSVSVSVSVPWN